MSFVHHNLEEGVDDLTHQHYSHKSHRGRMFLGTYQFSYIFQATEKHKSTISITVATMEFVLAH